MSIVHPGKVQTNNPSVTLENYSDANRDRFLFNGSQFIKAKLVVPRASFAYVGYIKYPEYSNTAYTAYKDVNGNYVLVNGEKYIPEATGAPSSSYSQYIIVGFPTQISTNEIYFWTTAALYSEGNLIKVQYSYDNSTYFDISGETVTWAFDDTIQQRAGESPPNGEYRYKISLGAYYTARYFKITSYAYTTLASNVSQGATTLTVTSTSDFVSASSEYNQYMYAWFTFPGGGQEGWVVPFIYTGKGSTSFTGVSFDWNSAYLYGTIVAGPGTLTSTNWSTCTYASPGVGYKAGAVFTYYNFVHLVTEVEVVRNTGPTLEVWDTDGSQAATQDLEFDYYYDIVYDKSSDKYFTIRQNTSYNGTAGTSFSLSDDFSGTSLDVTRWEESTTDDGFQLNTTSGTLECRVAEDRGQLTTRYYMDGDFTSDVHIGFNTFGGTNCRTEIRAIDNEYDNVFAQMGYRGPYTNPASPGQWEAMKVTQVTDTTGGAAYLSGLRVDTTHLPTGSTSISFTYVSASGTWTVTSGGGGTLSPVTPGYSYSAGPLDKMSIIHASTPANGASIGLNFNRPRSAAPATIPWTWRLGLSKSSDNLSCRYDDGTGSFTDWIIYTGASSKDFNVELFADNYGLDSDLSLDDFVTSGTGRWSDIPMLSIEAVNENGNRTYVSGLTDADGYLIKQFDVINTSSDYFDWGNGKIQLATDGMSPGNIYVKVGTGVYKYAKSSFPLSSEDGSGAALYKSGVMDEIAEVNFGYNAYTKAGLYYIKYDEDRDGVYVQTMSTSTVSGTAYDALLDVSVDTYPFAYDVNNYDVLYYVNGTSLKFYNMDESDVAFCNVSSDDKILSAGEGETSSVDAVVLNVYGEPLQSKTVTFSVSAGDGAVSPESVCSTSSGVANTTYTVGSTVGTATITATASDIAC